MPRAYSTDLRERALAAYEAGEGRQSEIARLYRVGERTLSGWLKVAREEGRRSPKPRRGGRPPVGGEREVLARLVAERNDATLAEYADLLAERAGMRRGPSALCRALKALSLVREKRRSRPPSGTGRTWPRCERHGAGTWPGRPGPPRLRRRDRDRHPHDPRLRPRRSRPEGARQGALGALGAADRDRRPRARRRGRQQGRRRRDRRGRVPGLRRAGPSPRAARPARRARGDGRPRRPQGREGARGAGPRWPEP